MYTNGLLFSTENCTSPHPGNVRFHFVGRYQKSAECLIFAVYVMISWLRQPRLTQTNLDFRSRQRRRGSASFTRWSLEFFKTSRNICNTQDHVNERQTSQRSRDGEIARGFRRIPRTLLRLPGHGSEPNASLRPRGGTFAGGLQRILRALLRLQIV